MEPINEAQIAAAINHLASLDQEGRSGLTEEIRANQPHAMFAIIKLSHEVETPQLDHAFYIMRVVYTAFSAASAGQFPLVTPENFAKAKRDLLALHYSLERGSLTGQVYLQFHPEPYLLLWIAHYLNDNLLLDPPAKKGVLVRTINEIVAAFVEVRASASSSAG